MTIRTKTDSLIIADDEHSSAFIFVEKEYNLNIQIIAKEENTNQLQTYSNFLTFSEKVVISFGAGSMIAYFFCLNIGLKFIKLFIIIEIIGKLYFAPVSFGVILEAILKDINNVGDFLNINENFITSVKPYDGMRYWNKLTINHQRSNILNSQPLIVMCYLVYKKLI